MRADERRRDDAIDGRGDDEERARGVCGVCRCSACVTLRTTLPFTRRQSPFDKSQLRYLYISSITRRSLYRFRTIRTAKAAVLAMTSAGQQARAHTRTSSGKVKSGMVAG